MKLTFAWFAPARSRIDQPRFPLDVGEKLIEPIALPGRKSSAAAAAASEAALFVGYWRPGRSRLGTEDCPKSIA